MSETTLLQKGDVLRLQATPGRTMGVHECRVWLTRYDDPRDLVLRAGDSAEPDRPGPVVVSAFEPSLLKLYRADPGGVRERLQRAAELEHTRAIADLFRRMVSALARVCRRQGATR